MYAIRSYYDTVCHYEMLEEDFEVMKSYYLKRDMQGLYVYSNQYTISSEGLYQELIKRLLTDRNHRMVERMQDILQEGNAFIAIGAMHLPGDDGVLALLEGMSYNFV